MKKLSQEEILKIPALLFSPDNVNKTIAVQLLKQHSYAIASILTPIEIFLAFHPEYNLLSIVQQVFPEFKLEEKPIYLLYLIQNKGNYLDNAPTILNRFSVNELNYRSCLLKYPEKASIYASIGEVFCQYDNLFDKGLFYYQLAINNSPHNTTNTLHYLKLLQKKYLLDDTLETYKAEIITHYNQAYQKQAHQDILYNLALFYQDQLKNKAAATNTWERCIKSHPKFNRAFFAYAQFQMAEKKWEKAKKLAQKSLNLSLSGVYYNLDEIYYMLGWIAWNGFSETAAAEMYFEKALEENEFYFQPLEALMELSLEKKAYTKAIRWHKRALKEIPFDIALMLKLAELYLKIYDLEQAIYYYNEILELNAAYPPALEGLKKIEQL